MAAVLETLFHLVADISREMVWNEGHVFPVLPPLNVEFCREFSLYYPKSERIQERDIFPTLTVW